METNSITLAELYSLIGDTIHETFDRGYWIKAEIARLTENYSGHCYLELVEKTAEDESVIAQGKAMIWSNIYRVLKAYFKTSTNRELSEGMKILFKARVEFHAVYGLSLHITDIDPSYTVGELALKKNQVIKMLKDEGIFDINRETILPTVPQRIAVISSITAAGYNDFVTHLSENSEGYQFKLELFSATMQGPKAEESIITALENINDNIDKYDAVAIIRGGGSQTDLSCFDSYLLACNVAQFPIPVITGIGHEQDDSVTDMVAHTRLKTPTAVAEFLIGIFASFDEKIDDYLEWTINTCHDILNKHNTAIDRQISFLPAHVKSIIHEEHNKISRYKLLISKAIDKNLISSRQQITIHQAKTKASIDRYIFQQSFFLENARTTFKTRSFDIIRQQNQFLEYCQNTANIADPGNTLQRGYSITKYKDKIITDSTEVEVGNEIETIVYKGKFRSKIV